MSSTDLPRPQWRKSSKSGNTGNCVEVADFEGGIRWVRDSKEPGGPILRFTESEWAAFIGGVKGGEFD